MTTRHSPDTPPLFEIHAENLYHCCACNYCVRMGWDEWGIDGVCATLEHHAPAPGYSGKGYIAAARAWREGRLDGLGTLAERAFTCTTCGNCDEACPIGMRPEAILRDLRAELAARGMAPAWAERRLGESAAAAPVAPTAEAGATLVVCSPESPASVGEGQAVLALLGPIGGVALHAAPLQQIALVEALGQGAEARRRLAPLLDGAARLVLVDADGLASAARARAGLEGVEAGPEGVPEGVPEVQGAVAAVLDAIESGRLVLVPRPGAAPPPAAVGLVQSCHLSKHAHGLQAADLEGQIHRLLGRLGIAVVGPSGRAARFTLCCGAAGGMPEAQPEAARRMARARAEALWGQGAEVLVAASPLCGDHLGRALPADRAPLGLFAFLLRHFQPVAATPKAGDPA